MIKNGSFRRILTASIALVIVLISIYLFPKNEIKIPSKTIYKKVDTQAIYLVDKNDYVARTMVNINSKTKKEIAYELISALINGTNKNMYIPESFKSYIPSNLKINSIKIDNDLITIDFNNTIFDLYTDHDEKIIESIVYTLTEIKGINKVKITINENPINKLPNSGKSIPEILTREIGINKITKFNTIKNTQNVTTYFLGKNNNSQYFIPITMITDDPAEKIEVIIKELESRDNIDNNLSSYLSAGVQLKNYQILENELNLEFNNYIFNSFNNIDEEVVYGLSLSIHDTYNIEKVNFEVNNKRIKTYNFKNS